MPSVPLMPLMNQHIKRTVKNQQCQQIQILKQLISVTSLTFQIRIILELENFIKKINYVKNQGPSEEIKTLPEFLPLNRRSQIQIIKGLLIITTDTMVKW